MDRVYLEVPTIGEVLQKYVRDYRRKHQRLSSAQVARRFGVSTSTLNRIELGDIRKPTVDQAIKILKGCTDAEAVTDFMRTYYPDIHKNLLEFFKQTSTRVEIEDDVVQLFCDESTYMMMLFATTKAGLRENWVLQEYGRTGHEKFMKLASKGILISKDGRFFASDKDVDVGGLASLRTLQYISKNTAEDIKTNKEVTNAMYTVEYSSVDYSKISKRLIEIYEEYKCEVTALLNKQENIGTDLIYTGTIIKLFREKI